MVGALVLGVEVVAAETRSVDLKAGETREVRIASRLDDRNFHDPPGYAHHGTRHRLFTRRITIENIGTEPLQDFALIANGKDWSTPERLGQSLRLPTDAAQLATRFYTFWKDHRFHATSGAKAQQETLATLNFWGYTLCDEDTQAIARFLHGSGIPARAVPLNGHVAAEYWFGEKWNIIDGDQNALFLRLDNQTFASAADLRADPFPALRTKIFGKYARMDLTHSRFNTALYEFISPREKKPMKFKPAAAETVSGDTLFPGEKLIYHFDHSPERAVGTSDLRQWGPVKESALRVVELVMNPEARPDAGAALRVASSSPIIEWVRHATGERVNVAGAEPVFETAIDRASGAGRLSVLGQRARIAFPPVQKGRNTLLLRAGRGAARVTIEYNPVRSSPPRPRIHNRNCIFTDQSPVFRIAPGAGADLIWWQIAPTREFALILPNFEAVQNAADVVVLDPLTETFFSNGQKWHFRFKARHSSAWSEWSTPFTFRVSKPSAPSGVHAVLNTSGEIELRWDRTSEECEYLVFGSNRLDFLPELYASEEIVRMRKLQVVESRPNQNLFATTRNQAAAVGAKHRYFRVIAKRGNCLSPPSALVQAPITGTPNLPPGKVLQMRAKRIEGPEFKNGYIDEYVAEEMTLPE